MKFFSTALPLSIACASAFLVSTASYARQLSPEEAFASVPAQMIPAATRGASSNLVYTQNSDGLNSAYIWAFGDNNGYLVTSADDVFPAVLGFADSGTFDPNNIPPAMEAWLAGYDYQLQYAIANGINANATRAQEHAAIAPLCSTKWGQDAPFSDLTPTSGSTHCPTGCTATAMAQVMKHHNWPKKGTGTNVYSYGSFTDLTFDFGNTEFDWDNMLDTYFYGYNDTQVNAVATLMAACGNAALMQYAKSSSGAYLYDALYGLVNFLGYDKSGYEAQRNFYSSTEWDNMIYGELEAGRPVVYSGYSNFGKGTGHTFVVDGYRDNGFYHLNWGWTGTSDGYFLLTVLNPQDQGTGGTDASNGGYDSFQSALIGLQPAKGSANHFEIYQAGNMKGGSTSYTRNSDVVIKPSNGYFLYCTLERVQITPGLNLTSVSGGDTFFVGGEPLVLKTYYGDPDAAYISQFSIPGESFPSSGTYYATPAYKDSESVKDMRGQLGFSNKLKITISGNTISVEQVAAEFNLVASNIRLASPLYSGKNCMITATITNNGEEYLGKVYPGLKTSSSSSRFSGVSDGINVSLAPGESRDYTFYGKFVSSSSSTTSTAAGTYMLNLYDKNDAAMGNNAIQVTMETAPSGNPKYTATFEFDPSIQGAGTNANPYIVGNTLEFNVKISVTSGFFDDSLQIYTMKGSSSYYDGLGDPTANFIVPEGESVTRTYQLNTSALPLDQKANLNIYGASMGWIGDRVYIMRSVSGVTEIDADDNASVEYYNLQGVRVENPSNGIFIRKQGSKVTKVYIK